MNAGEFENINEGNENFSVTLSNASSGNISTATATVTISDNDCTISLNPAAYTVAEDGGNAVVTVTRTGVTTTAVTVDYATGDGTALAGSDYTAAGGTLSFASGENSKTIVVPVTDDASWKMMNHLIYLCPTPPLEL